MAGLSTSYPVYAPVEDLNAYLGSRGPDPDAEAHLAEASNAIRYWTMADYYEVTLDGFTPSLQPVANAFHDAAILQAASLLAAGLKPGDTAAATTPAIQSKTLGSRSVTYAADTTATDARAALLGGALAPGAVAALRSVGLLSSVVFTGGRLPRRGLTGVPSIIDGGTP